MAARNWRGDFPANSLKSAAVSSRSGSPNRAKAPVGEAYAEHARPYGGCLDHERSHDEPCEARDSGLAFDDAERLGRGVQLDDQVELARGVVTFPTAELPVEPPDGLDQSGKPARPADSCVHDPSSDSSRPQTTPIRGGYIGSADARILVEIGDLVRLRIR